MRRYAGEDLGTQPRIAVVANDALGNYVAVTPLMQMLRARYPSAHLAHFGGERTRELWAREPMWDEAHALFGTEPSEALAWTARPFDLVVNVEASPWAKAFAALLAGASGFVAGPCLGPGGRGELPFGDAPADRLAADARWVAPDLAERHPILHRPFIAEILARTAWLEGEVPPYRLPKEPAPDTGCDAFLAVAASLPEKLWPAERWVLLVEALVARGLAVGLVGAPPKRSGPRWLGEEIEGQLASHPAVADLRGALSLPQWVDAFARARLVATLDNGILHLAAAAGAPTVGLFRPDIVRLWAPPFAHLRALVPHGASPVAEIRVEAVVEAVDEILANR